jgi:hypothetical protein
MSRGPGRIQEHIIDTLTRFTESSDWPNCVPVTFLAFDYAMKKKIPQTAHLHGSFRRAAQALARNGTVTTWRANLPTRWDAPGLAPRPMLCLTLDGTEPGPDDYQQMCEMLYFFGSGPDAS